MAQQRVCVRVSRKRRPVHDFYIRLLFGRFKVSSFICSPLGLTKFNLRLLPSFMQLRRLTGPALAVVSRQNAVENAGPFWPLMFNRHRLSSKLTLPYFLARIRCERISSLAKRNTITLSLQRRWAHRFKDAGRQLKQTTFRETNGTVRWLAADRTTSLKTLPNNECPSARSGATSTLRLSRLTSASSTGPAV